MGEEIGGKCPEIRLTTSTTSKRYPRGQATSRGRNQARRIQQIRKDTLFAICLWQKRGCMAGALRACTSERGRTGRVAALHGLDELGSSRDQGPPVSTEHNTGWDQRPSGKYSVYAVDEVFNCAGGQRDRPRWSGGVASCC
jgi:hypothetical protein